MNKNVQVARSFVLKTSTMLDLIHLSAEKLLYFLIHTKLTRDFMEVRHAYINVEEQHVRCGTISFKIFALTISSSDITITKNSIV
jgi:hypothetical protein